MIALGMVLKMNDDGGSSGENGDVSSITDKD